MNSAREHTFAKSASGITFEIAVSKSAIFGFSEVHRTLETPKNGTFLMPRSILAKNASFLVKIAGVGVRGRGLNPPPLRVRA